MSWIYKSTNRVLSGRKVDLGDVLPVCPKCHYILLVRSGERPIFCPMCGKRNLVDKKVRKEIK